MTLSKLDTDHPGLVKNYERALYRAFSATDIKSIPYIADYDHRSRRLRSHIPYSDQQIFAARVQETVLAAVALNTNMSAPLQLETFGFAINKSGDDVCEALALFSLDFAARGSLLLKLRDVVSDWLRKRRIRHVYSTCSERRLRSYEIIGFQRVDERKFHGEKKYLIHIQDL
jgi:hypothetical protein